MLTKFKAKLHLVVGSKLNYKSYVSAVSLYSQFDETSSIKKLRPKSEKKLEPKGETKWEPRPQNVMVSEADISLKQRAVVSDKARNLVGRCNIDAASSKSDPQAETKLEHRHQKALVPKVDTSLKQTATASGKPQRSQTHSHKMKKKISAMKSHFFGNRMDDFSDAEFDEMVKVWIPLSTGTNIANFMRISGGKSRSNSVNQLRRHLPAFSLRLQFLSSSPWTFAHISFVIYGLQCMELRDEGYSDIALTMSNIARSTIERGEVLAAQDLSMLLVGVQKIKLFDESCIQLFTSIVEMVRTCTEPLGLLALSSALYSLHDMDSDNPLVLLLVSALLPKIESCTESLTARSVGNILYGLQNMNSDHAEVRLLLSALAPKIQGSEALFTPQYLSSSLYGLKNCCSDSEEVRCLLSILTLKVQSCSDLFTAKNVSNSLFGLQGMKSDHVEVRAMLAALTPKIESCPETFNAQAIANAVFGLKSMKSDSPEVLALLTALLVKVRTASESLHHQQVTNALYGMQGMSSGHVEVIKMLSCLAPDQYTHGPPRANSILKMGVRPAF